MAVLVSDPRLCGLHVLSFIRRSNSTPPLQAADSDVLLLPHALPLFSL